MKHCKVITKRGKVSRRGFVKASLLASAAIPLGLRAEAPVGSQASAPASAPAVKAENTLPMGKIGGEEFSRLMLGGNLIGGYSHARDLAYVATLMRFYNTQAKIRETLEIAEAHGINAINTFVTDDTSALHEHWKNGGKMKWFAQVGAGDASGCPDIQIAVDRGASGIHINGGVAESLLAKGQFERVGEIVQWTKAQKRIAGVGAHDLRVIMECEKLKLDVDFYQKTLHTHDYPTAPQGDDTGPLGKYDNSWCSDPKAVIDFMAAVKKPWIAFKILAAGALRPLQAFPYAFNSGADFILVGMFDWQIAENAELARRVVTITARADSKRTRAWRG